MRLRIAFICIAGCAASAYGEPTATSEEHARFIGSDQCIACHSGLRAPSGEDVSIGYDWRASMMANSARDPYWHAAVRREVMDHPQAQAAIEDKCATCHMPMARFTAAQGGGQGQVFANLAAQAAVNTAFAVDGVSCTVCHQIAGDNFGADASFDGGFAIHSDAAAGVLAMFGPHEVDAGRQSIMRSATQTAVPRAATHLQQSELCATCHTLYTHALDENGNEIGRLAEQVPYQEWLHSAYRETRSCQSCHMPEVAGEVPISSVLGQPRPRVSQHTFRGSNAYMLGILNRYRGELGVVALPQELDAAIAETKQYLATASARLTIEGARRAGGSLELDVHVANIAGHKLPTAYPSRRAWLHVVVTDAAGRTLFESGAVGSDGAIAGNDNDADAARFEPHYDVIETAEQVQIYESIMVDSDDRVTTGLLRGVRYEKDNRLLPLGFDKISAGSDIAVRGAALDDASFTAGADVVHYRIAIPADAQPPLTVTAQLQYQSIGRRWAENLRAYEAAEPQRFMRYYDATAAGSALRLAAATALVQ
jgi:hypothetical protein